MSSWAKQRQLGYLGGVFLVIMVIISIPLYSYLTKEPTCFDGRQNGIERGVDCGGLCVVQCTNDIAQPVTHWARAFQVEGGMYDVAALVENVNMFGTGELLYRFRVYDADNFVIQERMGKSFALPHDKWVIFEGGVNVGERTPNRVFIDFPDTGTWVTVSLPEGERPSLAVVGQRLEEKNGVPRLSATVANRSPFPINDIEIVALVSDAEENTLGVSRTYIDTLPKYGEETVVFTWREQFADIPAEINIFPRVNYVVSSVSE